MAKAAAQPALGSSLLRRMKRQWVLYLFLALPVICVMVAPHRSQAHSRCSLLHWAHRRLLHPQFAMVVLLRPTACSTPASQFSMVASLRSQSSLEMLPASLGSSAAIAATGCAASFALIGLTTACFAHCARPSCAPPAAPPLSPSLDFRFACFAHCARRSSVPLGARFVRPRRTRRRGRLKCKRALPFSEH